MSDAAQKSPSFSFKPFRAPYASDDAALAAHWLAGASLPEAEERQIDAVGRDLIAAIQIRGTGSAGLRIYCVPMPCPRPKVWP